MDRPPQVVAKALERIQLNVASKQDEQLAAAWLEWYITQQMDDTEKWQTPAKRQRSSADA